MEFISAVQGAISKETDGSTIFSWEVGGTYNGFFRKLSKLKENGRILSGLLHVAFEPR